MSNDLLRSHVTRVGFDLSLGRTHIAALVMLNESLRQKRYIPDRLAAEPYRRTFAFFASGMSGCCSRGLVIHHYEPGKSGLKHHYTITKAGKLVIGLLRECGIYDEYADALPRVEAVS